MNFPLRTFCLCLASALFAHAQIQWLSPGPRSIGASTGIGSSGKIQTVAVSATDPKTIYVGGGIGGGDQTPYTSAGAFKSTDGGMNWTAINNGLSDGYINAIWVDPTNAGNVLLGSEASGIFHSTDGGQTWTQINVSGYSTGTAPVSMATSDFALAGSTLYAAMGAGIATSTDNGATWTLASKTTARVLSFSVIGSGVLAGTAVGRILSTASGSTILTAAGGEVWSVAADPATPTTIYAAIGNNSVALKATTDGGTTWNNLTVPAAPQAVSVTLDTHVVYEGTASGLKQSTDGGKTWTSVSGAGWNIKKIYTPDDTTIILGTDQGAFESTDSGKTWLSLTGNLSTNIVTGISVSGNTLVAAAEGYTPVVSLNGGNSWTQSTAIGQTGAVLINPGNPAWCYTFSSNGYQDSSDGCLTFTQPNGVGTTLYQGQGAIGGNTIAVDPLNPSTVYVGTGKGVYQSTDFGKTLAATTWGLSNITAVAVSPADSKTILVATGSGLNRTQDGGQTWTQISVGSAAGYPNAIAFNPQNPGVVLVGMSKLADNGGGVLRSTDGGLTFQLSNNGLPATSFMGFAPGNVETLALRFNPMGSVALAANFGAFLSDDAGVTWKNISGNTTAITFSDITWDGPYNLYAATWGSGVLFAQPYGPSPVSLQTDAQALSYTAAYGATTAFPSTANVTSSTGAAIPFLATVTMNSGTGWLTVGSASGTTSGTVSISANPTGLAPGTYTGKVSIFSSWAGNGPQIIPVSLTINPPPGTAPVIFTNGVVPIGSTISTISQGTWVTIYGLNLAPSVASWNNDFPTKLNGVSVTVDNKPAYLWYVSPGQINFQAPVDIFFGTANVVVTTPAGTATTTVNHQNISPSLNLLTSRYPAAVIPTPDGSGAMGGGTYDLVGPKGYFSFPTRPVKAGEVLELFGTGFGPTVSTANPGIGAALTGGPYAISNSAQITLGGVTVTNAAIALIGPGLYQANITIPNVPSGDNLLKINIVGANIPSGIYIAVQ